MESHPDSRIESPAAVTGLPALVEPRLKVTSEVIETGMEMICQVIIRRGDEILRDRLMYGVPEKCARRALLWEAEFT